MGQHLPAQIVHGTGAGRRRDLCEICVQAISQLPETRVLPAGLCRALQPGVVRLGVQIVRVHQRGEQHPDEEGRTEPSRVPVAEPEARCRQSVRQIDLPLPDGVQSRDLLAEAVFEGGDPPAVRAVGEPRMMARDAECQHLAELIAVAVNSHLGAGGGVIDSSPASFQSLLELLRVLPQVMQQPGDPADLGAAGRVEEGSGLGARSLEVLGEPVPLLPAVRTAGVCMVLAFRHIAASQLGAVLVAGHEKL